MLLQLKFEAYRFTMFMNNLSRFLKSENFVSTFLVASATIIGAFFSYLLQFLLASHLSLADFGTFNTLLSIAYIVSVPAGILGTPLVKVVAELTAQKEFKKLSYLFWMLLFGSLGVGLLMFLLLALGSGAIATFFKIPNPQVIIIYGINLGFVFLASMIPSFFQGMQRYFAYSIYTVLASFIRFVLPIALVFAGFQLPGVFTGLALVPILNLVFALLLLKKTLFKPEHLDLTAHYKRILVVSLPILFISLCLMLLNNVDSIFVKRFFDAETAGYYAGVVTLGKILLFGAGAVSIVMFPQITGLVASKKPYKSRFYKFFGLQLLVTSLGVLCFALFPSLLTSTFFPDRFSHSVQYLPVFAIFIGFFTLLNFLTLFFIAIERYKIAFIVLGGAVVQVILMLLVHTTLYDIVYINLGVCVAVVVGLLSYLANIKFE